MPPLSPDATRLVWCLRYPWARAYEPADATWDVTRSSRRPSMVAQPDAVVEASLALMAGMDKAHEVEWIGRGGQGWPLKRGAYGMHVPQVLVVLVDDAGALRWLVTGGPVPTGRYAMLFDSVKLGDDGQPHPRGLFAVTDAAADALWAASNAVSV